MYTFVSLIVTILLIIYIIKMVKTNNIKRWSIKGIFGGSKKYYLIAIIFLSIISTPFAPKQNKDINKNEAKNNKINYQKTTNFERKNKNNKDKNIKEKDSTKEPKKNDRNNSNKADENNIQQELVSYAHTFGNKPVDQLQKYVGSAYSSTQISSAEMGYGHVFEINNRKYTLIRVDNTLTKITKVYLYNKNKSEPNNEDLLYTGQTIEHKQKPTYVYY